MKVPTSPNFSEEATKTSGETVTIGKYDVLEKDDAIYDLATGLNYGQATGSAQMLRFVTEHTELVFKPPYADWQSCLTIGSTGALEQAIRMFCDKARGDSIITDEYAFSTALETAEPLGIKTFGVKIDKEGLIPESMDELLSNWDEKARGARRPHVVYTVPSGQNPTGTTMSAARRRAVYEVCQKHDVYIIEDEPYYYLQMQPYTGRDAPAVPPPATTEEFLDSLIPSLLSMDVDGRVLRMDSFSKVVIPGSRMGWVTGSEQIIERYQRHAEVASQGPAGISQIIVWKLLDDTWGHEGYLRWLMNLRLEYTQRRNNLLAACEDFLPTEVVSWNPPAAGMFVSDFSPWRVISLPFILLHSLAPSSACRFFFFFFFQRLANPCSLLFYELTILLQQQWLKVDYNSHPDAGKRGIPEIEQEIFDLCIEKGVLVVPGSWFAAEHEKPPTELFFRATFAAATPEKMREAIRRFGDAVRQSYRI